MTPVSSYTVLVALEDRERVDACAEWLAEEYDVETILGDDEVGPDIEDADVVLVDRGFPTYADGELIRSPDRRSSCLIAIVSGVDAEVGAVEISWDESLPNPPSRPALLEAVDRLRRRGAYDDALAACADLAAERGAMEAERSAADLEDDPEYRSLCRELERLNERVASLRASFDEVDYCAAFGAPDFTGASRVQRVGWPC